jgi:hypothetical protein
MLMAEHLVCQSCQVIAFQFHVAFSKAHRYSSKRMSDSQLLDVTGEVFPCLFAFT